MERATVLIIDPTGVGDIKGKLEKRSDFVVVGQTNNLDIGFTLAERHQPVVILLNVDTLGDDGFSTAEVFALEFPASSLILMTSSNSRKILRYALQMGAKEVINLPIQNDHFFKTINRVIQQEHKRRDMIVGQKKKRPQFKTATFFSTKGGVGKTTLALNTAIAIRELTKKRVVLIDLNLHSGNAALFAGVPWRRSIKELVDEINNIDEEMIENYCAVHPSGLKILPAPIISEYASFIQAEHVEKILNLMSQVFNYVIIDSPTSFHDTVIPALEHSQDIILVSTLDLASIQCLKQCIILLKGLSMRSKISVVVNQMGYSGGLKVKDLENELGMNIKCVIPDCEKLAVDAVNLGNPILISANKSSAAQKIRELAVKLITEIEQSAMNRVEQGAG
ncbi:MAG: AAA family ATPase [Eubacteriales bacterium]